jgi:ketosteroid isomerase-like protein
VRRDRSPLAEILADDFIGFMPWGEAITKANLMIDPAGLVKSVAFSEQEVHVFGDTEISRGRLTLDMVDPVERHVDQRFLRVFAKHNGSWRAIAVSVTPVPE